MSGGEDAELRGRVRRLLEFMREMVGSRSKPIRTYSADVHVEWLSRDPERPLEVNIDAAPGEVAVRVERISVEPRPLAELFRAVDLMRHDLETQPEALELVLASGFLTTKLGDVDIATHLVTQPATIVREESTGALLIHIGEASTPRLEDQRILNELDGFDASGSPAFQRWLAETVTSALAPEVGQLLQDWAASALHVPHTIEAAPALVLRKRGSYGLLSYYDAMLAALDQGADVPVGVAQLVETLESTSRQDWLNAGASDAPSVEPLFPLPANAAQSSIIDKLLVDTGVVVEGPPGTGKTHTIANLMSALMAQGQRILVTSEKSQALRVLRDKLPAELQDLCVSITDLARGGSAELDRSVSIIANRKAMFDATATAGRVGELTNKRNGTRHRRWMLLQQIQTARSSEAVEHPPIKGYGGTLAQMLTKLNAHRDKSWIPGPLHSDQPPLNQEEFVELTELLIRAEHHSLDRKSQNFPTLDNLLPPPDRVRALCAQVAEGSIDASDDLAEAADRLWNATEGVRADEVTAVIDALQDGDIDAFDVAVTGYVAAETEKAELTRYSHLLGILTEQAPTFARQMVEDADTDWPAVAAGFQHAWDWRWVKQWIDRLQHHGENEELDSELDTIDAELAALTARLAAEQAWQECLQRMTTREVGALRAYQDNMSNAGIGTGKLAQRYRVAARSAMQDAQTAVPAWIMPISQVLSSIAPQQNAFDVVIVDEASQAEITSIFLLWLAPRVIVVGDDRQCAPETIQNYSLATVVERLDAYLPDVPLYVRNTLTPRSSLFSMLRTRFNTVVRLTEHFRSMPEIISWSSAQFYQDSPLVPVRQFGADRVAPLKHTYISGAVTAGSSATLTNDAEARALVEQVCRCLADPDYDGKTFGVVVLQSPAQADLIRSLIFGRVPSEQRDERRLRVGTPPDFQGDERDVIFLSMVIAAGTSSRALTSDTFKRRFNVAATRARDQLWLFHSVEISDLQTMDLRQSLLSYVRASPVIPVPPMPDAVTATALHPSFGSLFEQQVFLAIKGCGYHVNPRVTINELTIDLVVTGAASRVAVECDDDNPVDAPGLIRRMEREFELRRCGWTFHRIRASDFMLDATRAMSALTELLDSVGVLPDEVSIVLEGDSSGRWSPIALEKDDLNAIDDVEMLAGEVSRSATTIAPLPSAIDVVEKRDDVPDTLRHTSREDLIRAITYAQSRHSFSIAQTVEDYDVTAADVHSALAEIRSAAVPLTSTSVVPQRVTGSRPIQVASVLTQLAELPVASWAGARELAVAAARPNAPLTVDRCVFITGLSKVKAESLLNDLVVTRRLASRKRNGIEEWIRRQDVKK